MLLADGRVLVTGGWDDPNEEPFASAELFDPIKGKWSTRNSIAPTRVEQTATRLADGCVLVAGRREIINNTATDPLSSAEIYDPATGVWSPTRSLNTARSDHTATRLLGGQVLVTGGRANTPALTTSAELYGPNTGLWKNTGGLNGHIEVAMPWLRQPGSQP